MLSFLRKIFPFNRKKSSPSVSPRKSFQEHEFEDEPDGRRWKSEDRQSLIRPSFDDFSSQGDDTISNRTDEEESFSGSFNSPKEINAFPVQELRSDDQVRRREIIQTLIEFGVISGDDGVDMLESPTRGISKDSHAKAFSRGFITVNNYFWFPAHLNLSQCFLDYLNFRCQGGEILLNLLTRKVSIEDEEPYDDNKESEEKSLVVFDLLKSGDAEDTEGFFYSFCSGQVVSSEDVDHCINCHVCFEHSFWNCARCGSSVARLCRLCNSPIEIQCDVCGLQETIEESFSSCTSAAESLQDISQLLCEEGTSSRDSLDSSGLSEDHRDGNENGQAFFENNDSGSDCSLCQHQDDREEDEQAQANGPGLYY